MQKFRHVMWVETYSVDNEVIDARHREFFSIFNRIVDLNEQGSTDVYAILRDLVDLVSEQFHVEHLFMGQTDYPGFVQHSKEHDMFIEALQGFLDRHEQHDERLVDDLLNFLNDWIAFHILKTDLRYREHQVPARKTDSRAIQRDNKPVRELRKTPRVTTSIEAYYWKRGSLDIFGKVQKGTILNLSLGGCCLLAPPNHMMNLHCKIHVAFLLDDRRGTKIEKEAVVCRVTENQIGCKFTSDARRDAAEFASYINERIARKS
jgi:hemerythrin